VTWLYVPGDRPGRFAKALASGADAVIVDLEDAVLAPAKDAAREHAARFLAGLDRDGSRPRVHVRINHPRGPYGAADLAALAGLDTLDAIRVPKVEGPADIDLVRERAGDGTPLHCLIESARGVENASLIAAHPAVAAIALGEADLAAELGLRGQHAFAWLRVRIVVAAAAAGLPAPAMAVHTDIADDEGLLASCLAGRDLGMFGRTAIHPRQLPVIRRAFTPGPDEIARARDVVEAAEAGAADGSGAVALPDGRFVDAPVVESARRTLALARRLTGRER
jgi:citrate lyase subunit beta/citryl-CoA lyase